MILFDFPCIYIVVDLFVVPLPLYLVVDTCMYVCTHTRILVITEATYRFHFVNWYIILLPRERAASSKRCSPPWFEWVGDRGNLLVTYVHFSPLGREGLSTNILSQSLDDELHIHSTDGHCQTERRTTDFNVQSCIIKSKISTCFAGIKFQSKLTRKQYDFSFSCA